MQQSLHPVVGVVLISDCSRKAPMSVGSFLPMTFNMERKADREEFKMTYEG